MSVTGSWLIAGNAGTGGAGDAVNFAGWNNDVNESVLSATGAGFPIGFNLTYGGNVYNRFAISSTGHITLGKSNQDFAVGRFSYNSVQMPGSGPFGIYGPTATGLINLQFDNSIRVAHRSWIPNIGATVKYQLTGSSPNQVLTVEWANFSRSLSTTIDNCNFQCKIYENGNKVEAVYGPMTLSTTGVAYYNSLQVGLRGVCQEFVSATAPTFGDRLMVQGAGAVTWPLATTNLTTPSTTAIDFKNTNFPASGLTYTWSPPVSYPGCGPNGLVSVSVVGTTATCTFPAATFGGPTNYQVERRLNDGSYAAFVAVGGSPFATSPAVMAGLTLGASYECRIRTNCSGVFSKWSTFIVNVPGPGENCASAIGPVSIAASIGSLAYTVVTAGSTQDGPASCAGGGPSDDVWYTFVAPNDGSAVILTTTAQGVFDDDWVMEVFDGCVAGVPGALIACNDDQIAGVDFAPQVQICQFEYIPLQTYYVRLYTWGSTAGQQIQFGAYKAAAPCPIVPANNECASATVVTLEDYGNCPANQVVFTTENATPSVGQPGASCDATTKNDVFIKFNSGIYSSVLVNVSLVTATQLGMQVMTACGGTQVFCANPAAGFRTINGLTPGQDYYIRLWSNNSTVWGNFNICVQKPGTCPTDLGAIGAILVPTVSAGTPYNVTGQTTCGSGNDLTSTLISSSCGSSTYLSGEDNVYYFDVASAGLYEILVSGSNSNLGIKLYNGCPLAGNSGICVANAGSTSSNQKLLGLNLSPGNTYYLIVDKASGSCNLSFSVDIQVAAPAPVNDGCATATTITQGAVCSYVTDYYNAAGTNSGAAVCAGSSADADDDVWFKFVANTSDPIITVNPSSGYAPVIQLFGPTACGGPSLCCVTAGSVGAATSLRPTSPLLPGLTYFVRVYDFFTGPPSTDDFDICVADAPIPSGSCVTCPGLSTAELEACGASSNGTSATAETVTLGATVCGKGFNGCNTRDIDYYKFTTPGAGYFTATVNAEFQMVMQIFNSDGVTVLSSANLPSECSGNVSLTNPTSLPAGTYYLLVAPNTFSGYPCGSARNDYIFTTSYSVSPPPAPANDNCSGAITLFPCVGSTAANTLNATQSLPAAVACAPLGFTGANALDVWFKFTANSTLHQIVANGTFNGVMQVFADYCGGPVIQCMDGDNPSVGFETLNLATTIGRTYYIRYYALATVGFALPGTFSMTVSTPNGWSGATSTDWNLASNWCSGAVPGAGTNIVVPDVTNDPVMLTSGACNNLLFSPGGNITVTPGNLTVNGNITATSNNSISGTGAVVFGGAALATLTGNLTVQNANVTNTNTTGFAVNAGSALTVNGVLTPAANSRTTATGNVLIVSNATTNGSIGQMGAGAQLNGTNYTIQRYVPTVTGWHFLGASSTGNSLNQWTDDFDIKTGGPVGGTNGVIAVGSDRSSIFEYIEAVHNFKLDSAQKDGWRMPVVATITPGKGYRAFMSNGYFANNPSHIIDNTGGVTNGLGAGFILPGGVANQLTRNEYFPCFPSTPTFNPTVCNESNRGWNLLANPFASNINWDAASGWTKDPRMNNAFFTYDAAAGGYKAYLGTVGAAGVNTSPATPFAASSIIPKGQGFMVKLTTAGTYNASLTATEAVKTATAATFIRSAVAQNQLGVRISKNDVANYAFDAIVRFVDGATDGFDQNMEAHLLRGENASLGFVVGNEEMVISSYAPLTSTKTIPVKTYYGGQVGAYKLNFTQMETFEASQYIYLKDKFLNALVDIKANPVYNFNTAWANNSNLNERFELVFSPSAITEVKPALLDGTSFGIFPNPTAGKNAMAYVTGSVDEKVTITVTDMVGRVVYKNNMSILADGEGQHEIKAKLSAGVYNVTCVGKSKVLTTKMVVN